MKFRCGLSHYEYHRFSLQRTLLEIMGVSLKCFRDSTTSCRHVRSRSSQQQGGLAASPQSQGSWKAEGPPNLRNPGIGATKWAAATCIGVVKTSNEPRRAFKTQEYFFDGAIGCELVLKRRPNSTKARRSLFSLLSMRDDK